MIICHKKNAIAHNHDVAILNNTFKLWLNAHNDITLWIKVPHPLLFNVKLNAIFLKLDIPNTFYDNKKVS